MNDVNPEAIRILATAQHLQDSGDHVAAEAAYIRGIDAIGDSQPELSGTLYLNLGNNASDDERDQDALGFFRRAVELLRDLRGEAILQSAHAYFNMARILLRHDDPEAINCSQQALERYLQYPFSSPVDIADARALDVVISASLGHSVSEAQVRATWEAMVAVPFEQLQPTALDCLGIIMSTATGGGIPVSADELRRQVKDWSGLELP